MKEVRIGAEVKDVITKAKGIVIGKANFLYGCVRVCVQPPMDKDGKVPDSIWVDEEQLEETTKKIVQPAPLHTHEFKVGDLAKDIITGKKGIVTCICCWFGGSVRIFVQEQKVKVGEKPVELEADTHRFKLIKSQVIKRQVPVAEKKKKAKPPAGPREDSKRSSKSM